MNCQQCVWFGGGVSHSRETCVLPFKYRWEANREARSEPGNTSNLKFVKSLVVFVFSFMSVFNDTGMRIRNQLSFFSTNDPTFNSLVMLYVGHKDISNRIESSATSVALIMFNLDLSDLNCVKIPN